MRHRPSPPGAHGRDADAAGHQQFVEPVGGQAETGHVKKDQVRIDRLNLNALYLIQALGKCLGVLVIVDQAIDVVLERIDRPRGDDAGLAHSTTKLMFPAPSPFDKSPRPSQGSPNRCAQALAEIDPDRINLGGIVCRRDAGADHRIEQARPIHVGGQSVLSRHCTDLCQGLERPYGASAQVRCLFDLE